VFNSKGMELVEIAVQNMIKEILKEEQTPKEQKTFIRSWLKRNINELTIRRPIKGIDYSVKNIKGKTRAYFLKKDIVVILYGVLIKKKSKDDFIAHDNVIMRIVYNGTVIGLYDISLQDFLDLDNRNTLAMVFQPIMFYTGYDFSTKTASNELYIEFSSNSGYSPVFKILGYVFEKLGWSVAPRPILRANMVFTRDNKPLFKINIDDW